ncbi:MAG: membrane integrity-associated transporter subunit PqiC [Bdellovibrionales bacterium]|nr:membrane integrity-associated transporter subunit PqiC [Bdellovibrionales bacterium]
MKVLFATLICLFLAGCELGIPTQGDDRTYFVLEDVGYESDDVVRATSDKNIVIRNVDSSSFVSSQRMVFAQDASTRGYYRFAFWVESPTRSLASIIANRLQAAEIFQSVVREGSGTVGDLQLNTDLLDFYHDVSKSPGSVVVKLRAELVDLRHREIIASKLFEQKAPASGYSAQGAAEGFNQAVSALVSDLVLWVADSVSGADKS